MINAFPERHVLIVTGPARERLSDRFERLYRFSSDVVVVRDRRYRERRAESGARPSVDRRRADRRLSTPRWVFPPESV